ncbi:MAG: AsmA family protein [Hyphomicrobiaceae bacterium]
MPDYDHPDDSGSGIGRKLVYAFLVLVALVAIGLGALVVAPPIDLVRAHVVSEVERQTGRKLTIGSAGVSFASGLGVSLDNVALSAPPAMGGEPLLTAERVEVSLALLPLVAREVKVERLTLIKPVLHLRVDRDGRRSWQFADIARDAAQRPLRYAEAPGRGATDAGSLPPEVADFMRNASPPHQDMARGLDRLALADVRIAGGSLRYVNARSAFAHEVTDIDATLSLPDAAGPLTVKGEITLAGQRTAVDLQLDDVRGLLADRSVAVRAALDGKAVNASFNGRVATGAKSFKEGKLTLKSPSAGLLARALGLPLIGVDALGAVSLDGQLRATDESVMLTSATFAAGQSSGTGTLGLETGGERPRLTANMRLAALHLDQFSSIRWDGSAAPPSTTSDGPASPNRFATPDATPPLSDPPRSIGDLLQREGAKSSGSSPAARVKGFRKRLGNQWEVDAIDVAPLRTVDVEARLQIASLHSELLKAENLQTGVELKEGVLRLSLTDGRVADGVVRGLASIDARQPSMTVGANLSGDNVALKPLLALAGIDLVDGKGRLIVAVSAKGVSERELVSTLAGRAEIKVTDGALVGWDADAIVSDLARGHMPPAERRLEARTPFKEFSGNFHIAQGVARSRDLKLDSNTVTASGTATINIVDRNVDILLKPKVAAGGLEVPVRIAGAWDSPSLVADVAGVLKSPQAKEAVRNLKDGNVEGALRSVLGDGPKAEKKIDKAKELLRGLLGR